MKKKRESKRVKKPLQEPPRKASSEAIPVHSSQEETEEENPFDFGGIPNRDLKKNLGCS
ncbi:MAG: hypothetical protein MUE95_01105 [Cyclobacteriaceae bacterium]|jgi:hypothetical protein|nr:hypothetical protein [Cyclobacteriaceae bacterium]